MDSTTSSPPARPAFLRLLAWRRLLPALAFLLYGLFLFRWMGAGAGGSDSSGYLNNARLLSQGRLTLPLRLLPGLDPAGLPPYTHVPLGFIPNPDHVTMTPTYPMGLSLMIALFAVVAGWTSAPGLVIGLHALLGIWLVYRLARVAGLGPGWAWLGGMVLAASPVYLFMSLQAMSDMPAMVWVTIAVLSAWLSRERPALALLAGAALALAVLLRPTDLLIALPVAIALGRSVRSWLWLLLGGLPGAVFQGALNLSAYGRVFTTGYGFVDPNFGLANILPGLLHYARWLPVMLTPLVLLALAYPVVCREHRRFMTVLIVWALVVPAFYLFYTHTHDDWTYLRFLLPVFPPLLVASLLVARRLTHRFGLAPRAWWLVPACLAVLALDTAWSRYLHAYTIGRGERVYPLVAHWLQAHLPADAVVASMQTSGALLYYTKFTFIRWDMMSPAEFQRIAAACTAAGRPVYAALFPFEIEDPAWRAFPQHLAGHWTQIGAVREVTIWRFDAPPAPP